MFSSTSYCEYPEIKWSAALRQAAALAGIVVLNSRNENEAIKDIVENVTRCGFMRMSFMYYLNKLEHKLLRGWL
ncbi:hypothetical protein P8452_54758 [Trifolium repens]|nr:hypothetical protein P8452_54758 [Trifolium repens]